MLKILIVDDNADAASTLASLLRLWGHDVQVCYSGLEALKVAPSFGPDLIFLDMQMPEMHGGEVAEAVRSLPALGHSRIVALSANDPDDSRFDGYRRLFDDYVIKPCNLQDLERQFAYVESVGTSHADRGSGA